MAFPNNFLYGSLEKNNFKSEFQNLPKIILGDTTGKKFLKRMSKGSSAQFSSRNSDSSSYETAGGVYKKNLGRLH